MDFHCLSRRELQALCKKNKIPANMTNVAMADALKALEIVEGIEEYLKPMESETSQSSIESPVKSEETSPFVLQTVSRSTRRRNVVREEPETFPSRTTTTTRRSTRKAVVGDEGEKALAATTRRRAQGSMVRRKVETQFEEENGDEKKTLPPTPAPLGTTSWRKVKEEESTVKKVYSTRRSVRLAEKSVEMLKSNDDEKLETLKQELFTKEIGDNLDVNLKLGSDVSDKVLEISGVDTKTMASDNWEREVEDPEFSMESSKNMENQLDLISEIQEDGSHNTCISEDMDSEVSPDFVVDENSSCDVDSEKETEKELKDEKYKDSEVFPDSLSELNVETPAADVGEGNGIDLVKEVEMEEEEEVEEAEADFEFIDQSTLLEQIDNGEEPDSTETLQHEQNMQDADQVSIASLGEVSSDDNLDCIDDSTFPTQIGERIEILESEQSKQESDQVAIEGVTALIPTVDLQSTPIKKSPNKKTPKAMKKMDNTENIDSGSKFLIFTKEKVKTPSKTPTTNDVTDNKENIDSGKKMILLTNENVKKTKEQNLHELSLRKLTKMFKVKLQITNQLSKNENDPKAATATATSRPALQALPENQLLDEAQN